MELDIETFRKYFEEDAVLISEHAAERFQERGIKISDIRYAIGDGEIIEQYLDDFPFPSCLILGTTKEGKMLHTVMSDEGSMSRIITAYYPDPDKWSADFKVRKD